MLLREKIETGHFSSSEKTVVDYILKEGTHIQNKTVKEIAEATYTVPSTLIRIAKKLNYNGWNDLFKENIIIKLKRASNSEALFNQISDVRFH